MGEGSGITLDNSHDFSQKNLGTSSVDVKISTVETKLQPLSSDIERAYLAELQLQIPKVKSGVLSKDKLDRFVNEMTAKGIDENTIAMLMQENELEILPKLSEDIKKAGLTELSLQAKKALSRDLPIESIQAYIDELKARGWDKEELRATILQSGIQVLDKQHNGSAETEVKPLTSEEILDIKNIAHLKTRELEEKESAWEDVPTNLSIERDKLTEEIGMRFRAHGIAKSRQFDALLGLLNGGIDPNKPFYTVDLKRNDENEIAAALGAAGPYDTGSFIVLSPPHELNQITNEVDISTSGIAGVLVNQEWYHAIPRLEQAYPDIKFIRADQMTTGLTNWLNEVDKK